MILQYIHVLYYCNSMWVIVLMSIFFLFFQKEEKHELNPFAFVKDFGKIEWNHLWDIFLVRFLLGFAVMVSMFSNE